MKQDQIMCQISGEYDRNFLQVNSGLSQGEFLDVINHSLMGDRV